MKFDYSNEALRRMAEDEDRLGPIGDGESVIGGFAQAKRRHSEALAALSALGEAIATVARAQMIGRAAAGHTITVDLGARAVELWQHGGSLCVSEYSDRAPRRLREIEGRPEDCAAEAVAALLEECER